MNIFKKKQAITEMNGITQSDIYTLVMRAFDSSVKDNLNHYYIKTELGTLVFHWQEVKSKWIPINPDSDFDLFVSSHMNKIMRDLVS